MTYAVKEAFLTLQGEGAQAGRHAVFARFAGCNLWSGREADRATADCNFCDTDFVGTDGDGGGKFADASALADHAAALWGEGQGERLVVITGGEPLLRFGDLGIRLTANLYGAPALSAKEFTAYRQDTIVGVSLLVTVPSGQYYPDKLVNIGTNRWSFRPEAGISKSFGNWILEGAGAASFFTTNEEFYPGAGSREQAPLYSLQGHAIYTFRTGMWAALDATYYFGGRTTVNGVSMDDRQQSARWGATFALPVDPTHSLKVLFSSGVFSRTGSDFSTVGAIWQYRWVAGR